jgi:hypothetical protein
MSEDMPRIDGVRAWLLGRTGRRDEIEIGAPGVVRGEGGILWIDCCQVTELDAAAEAIEALNPAGLSRTALGHLFDTIGPELSHPGTWADPEQTAKLASGLGLRFLNAFWAKPVIDIGVYGTPVMLFSKVSFLVGGDWLITNRTRGFGVTSGLTYGGDPVPLEGLRREVDLRWHTDIKGGGDVAMLMLRSLCASFRPALAEVERRLQSAELSFTRGMTDSGAGDLDAGGYREELLALKWVVDGSARDIASLNRRASSLEGAWFHLSPGSAMEAAEETQELIEEAMATCARQAESVRSGFELIAATQGAEQLQLSRENQERGTGFERRVGQLAAVLGGPALVVGFFDAMPEIVSGCPLVRGILIVALMVLAAIVLWRVLRGWLPEEG